MTPNQSLVSSSPVLDRGQGREDDAKDTTVRRSQHLGRQTVEQEYLLDWNSRGDPPPDSSEPKGKCL